MAGAKESFLLREIRATMYLGRNEEEEKGGEVKVKKREKEKGKVGRIAKLVCGRRKEKVRQRRRRKR